MGNDQRGFETRRIARRIDNTSYTIRLRQYMQQDPSFDWEMAPYPTGKAGAATRVPNNIVTAWKGTTQPEAAWTFMKFMASKEATVDARGMPSRLSLGRPPEALGRTPNQNWKLLADAGAVRRSEPRTPYFNDFDTGLHPRYDDRYRGHPISNAVEILSSVLAVFYLVDGDPREALLAAVRRLHSHTAALAHRHQSLGYQDPHRLAHHRAAHAKPLRQARLRRQHVSGRERAAHDLLHQLLQHPLVQALRLYRVEAVRAHRAQGVGAIWRPVVRQLHRRCDGSRPRGATLVTSRSRTMIRQTVEGGLAMVEQGRMAAVRRTRRTMLRGGAALGSMLAAGAAACTAGGQQAQPGARAKLPPMVVFASNTGQADLPYFERFGKWFEEQNPGTKVDLVLPPGEGSYEAKMIAMFAGGTSPDVFHLHFTRVREFWNKGTLAPIDQFIKSAKTPVDDFIPGTMVPYRIKGQVWGLPRDNATGVMYYNKELLTANGV